ncbi:MAG: O-antigen ligase family protein [Bacteroidales bacterium]|nr:O-antigen ligase family protein [Bacteroidales bacterium]
MKVFFNKIELFLLCFIVFVIPVSIKLSSLPMIALLIMAFLKKENYPHLIKLFKTPFFYILIMPYLFLWLGLFNTEHIADGLRYIIRASSLILFPIILTAFKSNNLKFKNEFIFTSFILGVFLTYIICLNHAIPIFFKTKDYNVFFYQDFSKIITGAHHMSYFVIFAIVILISNLLKKTNLPLYKNKYLFIKIFFFLIFSIFLFQLSSKATIILYVLLAFFTIIFAIFRKMISYKIAIPVIIITLSMIVFGLSTNKAQIRFSNLKIALQNSKNIDSESQESTALRLVAYKAGVELIKNNFWFGVGTGDIVYEYDKFYFDNNYKKAYSFHTDPHNQFARTFVSNGVFAFISLLSIFILLFHQAFKKKHFLLLLWTIICILLFNVEDMFSYQRGVMFFSFFTSYFIFNPDISNNKQSLKLKP